MSGHGIFPFSWDPAALWWLPLAALALDLVIGDPPRLPHPVRGIAWLADRLEKLLRPRLEALDAGAAGTALVLAASGSVAYLVLFLPKVAALAAWLYLAFAGLALGQLLREGKKALHLLQAAEAKGNGNAPALDEARTAVQQLVSRDVSQSDAPTLAKTLAETLSENLNDAFVAPFFWLMLGGPVGLWLYKAASTLDSMWGYPHEPWTRFGRVAAKLDDALAFVPARLTVLFLRLSAPLCGARGKWPGWPAVAAQARSMASPNAGWPMAACAWLHGAPMGGPALYNGVLVEKPRLGPQNGEWDAAGIRRLIRHLGLSGAISALALWLLCLALAALL